MGGDGPRATPVYDGGRVYALGANGEFRALEAATGRTLWAKNILAENGAPNIQWGMAASPLVVDGKVIVLPGGPGNSVVAYDKLSGKKLWGALDDRAAYTAPVTAVFFGFRQLLVVTASRAVGLHVQTGELLWEFPWQTQYDVNATLPIISGHNSFILSAGYDHGSVRVGLRRSAQRLRPYLEWESKALKARFNNAVLFEDTVYGLDEGILVAMDAATGQRRWKAGRYGYGQLLLAEGHLIILTEHGELVLVRATPARHTELARFEAIDGKTWNVPAMADGHLIVRNTNEMASFKIAP
jgi:outer membrane protein assembly factor BamB